MPIPLPMMRAINALLTLAAVAALVFGGYWVGHAVWQTGKDNRDRVERGSQTTATPTARTPTTAVTPARAEPDKLGEPWVRAVLFASGAIVVLSVISSAIRILTRRARGGERWHA